MSDDLIYPIAKFENIQRRVESLKYRSDDVKSRLAEVLKGLWNPERKLKRVSTNADFANLRQNFPQFNEVIDYFENTVVGLSKLSLPFEIPPVLLLGDPGLGKTYFANELCKVIELPFYEISLATTTASFGLSGANIQWAEGSPGFIATTLANSDYANSMILIDEIDKAEVGVKYNPLNVFYGLLESHSSKRFRDEAIEVDLDASKLIWVATANQAYDIPDPITSRMRTFHIKQPSVEVMPGVIKSIYTNMRSQLSYGSFLDPSLDDGVIHKLIMHSPRVIKLAIEESAFKAIRHNRSTIRIDDLPNLKKESRRVGFI